MDTNPLRDKVMVTIQHDGVIRNKFVDTWQEAVDEVIAFARSIPPQTPGQVWIEGRETGGMIGAVLPLRYSRYGARDTVYTGGVLVPLTEAKARVEAALGKSFPNGPFSRTSIINLWKDR